MVQEKLNAVGLPGDAMPVDDASALLANDWKKWIEKQKEAEQMKTECPPPLGLDELLLFKPTPWLNFRMRQRVTLDGSDHIQRLAK